MTENATRCIIDILVNYDGEYVIPIISQQFLNIYYFKSFKLNSYRFS